MAENQENYAESPTNSAAEINGEATTEKRIALITGITGQVN